MYCGARGLASLIEFQLARGFPYYVRNSGDISSRCGLAQFDERSDVSGFFQIVATLPCRRDRSRSRVDHGDTLVSGVIEMSFVLEKRPFTEVCSGASVGARGMLLALVQINLDAQVSFTLHYSKFWIP